MAQSTTAEESQKTDILKEYYRQATELRSLRFKLIELETDLEETTAVLERLKQMNDPDRRCYRILCGILIKDPLSNCVAVLQVQKEKSQSVVKNVRLLIEEKDKQLKAYSAENRIFPYSCPTPAVTKQNYPINKMEIKLNNLMKY